MPVKQNRGDIVSLAVRNNFDVLFHNARWDRGISREIGEMFREARTVDKKERLPLGQCSHVKTRQGVLIVNGHFTYLDKQKAGSTKRPRIMVHFDRFQETLKWLNEHYGTKSIAMPKLASNDEIWAKMLVMIEKELPKAKVTIVESMLK
jgi:hypothetical protein